MMDELIKTLRADWPEILVEKHWMMDSDAIEKQRSEAADAIEVLRERVKRVENNNRELRGSKERVYAATDLRQPTQASQPKAVTVTVVSAAAADRIEALQAEVTRLKDKLSVETEPSPYCPICGSCGEEGCCGSRRCLYPAALQEQSK